MELQNWVSENLLIVCIAWYLIGSFGSAIFLYLMFRELSRSDILVMFTLGGLLGAGSAIYFFIAWLVDVVTDLGDKNEDYWNKKIL